MCNLLVKPTTKKNPICVSPADSLYIVQWYLFPCILLLGTAASSLERDTCSLSLAATVNQPSELCDTSLTYFEFALEYSLSVFKNNP